MPGRRGNRGGVSRERLEQRVGEIVRSHPNAVALECGSDSLTYDDLWHAAGTMAADLQAERPANGRYGLIVHRSTTTYVLYLAILRAGGTVVPIAPESPAARRSAIVEQAELTTVVSGHDDLDGERWSLSFEHITAEQTGTGTGGRNDIAYILFTSGSTGRPKGVPIGHNCVIAFLERTVPHFGLGPGCRMTQLFDLTFDVSIYDLFGAWCSGATLVVPSRVEMIRPVPWARSKDITHWASVPSTIVAARLSGDLKEGLPDLRWASFIGEPLPSTLARDWAESAPLAQLVNFYGPTELTIAVSTYLLPRGVEHWPVTANGTVPIGTIYPSMDWRLKPVTDAPAGAGELIVRGPQRFDGYVNPEDNRERFVPDRPFPQADSWYRTGDLVAQLHGGELVHLGRVDDQVKIRGYRVELLEIESAIRRHRAVADAAVISHRPADAEVDELVAFVRGGQIADKELRAHLLDLVPRYMLPKTIQFVAAFPLTPSGKVDRKALLDLFAAGK